MLHISLVERGCQHKLTGLFVKVQVVNGRRIFFLLPLLSTCNVQSFVIIVGYLEVLEEYFEEGSELGYFRSSLSVAP